MRHVQQRDGRWCIVDLLGKHRRVRIASVVPTARFAQPIVAAILYPMIGLCGLFVPVQSMPPALQVVAHVLPHAYAVSLLEGIRKGEAWSTHMGDVAALVVAFVICTALSAKVFRWE